MKKIQISMIQQAQLSNDIVVQATKQLTEMATSTGITLSVLVEDVQSVLANFSANVANGKGLIAMGGNVNNYAYFLAGLEAIVMKLTDTKNPQPQPVVVNTIKRLSGLAIQGGMITTNSQSVVDFGARPENQQLATKYEQLVKNSKADSRALVNAIGQLQMSIGKLKVQPATGGTGSPQGGTAPAMQQRPVTKTPNTLPPSGPSRAGAAPTGG